MKIVRGESKKQVKQTAYKLLEEEGEYALFSLTPRMVSALLSGTEMLSWRNRHISIPSDLSLTDDFQSWIDTLRFNLMNPLDFCQLMIDNSGCFFSDTSVQNNFDIQVDRALSNPTIIDRLTTIYNTYNNGVSPEKLTGNLFNEECNLDSIYAQVNQLVDTLDGLSTDILQLVTQAEGIVERIGVFVSAIPAVEATPIPALFDFVQLAIDGVKTEYEGTYTESLEISLKCEIQCLIKNGPNCEFNFTQILAFYLGKLQTLSYDDPLELVNAIINYLASGDIDGDIAVYALHAFSCAVLSSGSSFLGETFTGLVALIYAKKDEENNDWRETCLDCPPDEVSVIGLVPFPGFEPYCSATFLGLDGTDELWQIDSISSGGEGSFAMESSLDRDFYIIEETVVTGSFTNVREYANPFLQTPAPFDSSVLITFYMGAFWLTLPARMILKLRPA